MTNNNDFLKNLKVGDSVILWFHNFFSNSKHVETVQNITPKGFIKVKNMLFNPDTGHARGDYDYKILEATPEAVKEIEENNYIQETFNKLRNTKKLNYEQAIEIRAIIDKNNNENPQKIREIADTYGIRAQTDMMIEEMSELIKALLKYRRVGCNVHETEELISDIVDEAADVQIMLWQMIYLYGLNISDKIDSKINRQIERIKGIRHTGGTE